MTTEKAESKLYESLPQPNEDKPITVDTFSPWVIPVARIKRFNGVKNSPEIMAVYSHLLGWKKTTGEIRPSQQYIADCCCMGLSTVQKKVKVLVKMGWITATPARKPGSKEISHTDYTVKDPEEILAEQNAGLSQQGDAVVTIAKNQKVKAEESGKDEQKQQQKYEQPTTVASETAAPVAGKPDGVPHVDAPIDADLSGGGDAVTVGNVVEFSRGGRPRGSFKPSYPEHDQEETYQGYSEYIEPDPYYEPTQADFEDAEALIYGG
ncbi:hypothetical protein GHV37_05260 [Citrobacter koseri]|uniref:hypothetical protein n=1 Tax=Citrobacter koseri TaxID=545 RepID=UPI001903BE73|nr:hypothetical protein [Citrobacter koseri]MBJ9234054.1 hypothetical protein [Citrobacter koseri]